VLKDRQKVDMYEKKLLAYAAAKKLSKYFVLLQSDQKPEGRLPLHYYKVPCASDSSLCCQALTLTTCPPRNDR
jgi:hypothetical protein